MSPLEYARERLRSFLHEADRLSESEFPYTHSRDALDRIRQLFRQKLKRLDHLTAASDPEVVSQESALALSAIFEYLPLLGFILRSTNTRNAFEIFGPLLRLSTSVLEPCPPDGQRRTRLVISSEWDYSPLTYTEIPDLPDFVLIGLPAPESSNPLIIPLAGHELGHSLWLREDLAGQLSPKITRLAVGYIRKHWTDYLQAFPSSPTMSPDDLMTDLFTLETWQAIVPLALKQSEETFCDFVGLRLFGTAYLHAFAYLLAPNYSGPRSVYYPNMVKRVANLVRAARRYGVSIHAGYAGMFRDLAEPHLTQAEKFRLSAAEAVLERLVGDLMKEARNFILASNVPLPSRREKKRILARLKHVVPAEHSASLGDILAAAWDAERDPRLWSKIPQVQKDRKGILKELILKNIEVFEIEQRLGKRAGR